MNTIGKALKYVEDNNVRTMSINSYSARLINVTMHKDNGRSVCKTIGPVRLIADVIDIFTIKGVDVFYNLSVRRNYDGKELSKAI